MTLNDFFAFLGDHPYYVLAYLIFVPVFAAIIGIVADERSPLDPWRQIFMLLLYMICIPGIFAVTLFIYSFLFEQRSIFDIDLFTQVLPVISMIITILVVKKYVSLDDVPGFGKLTGLIMMITVVLVIFWVLQKMRIVLFTYLPFQYVLLILVALLLVFRIGMKRMFR